MTIRIRDWSSNFEHHRSKLLHGPMTWVKIPVKLYNPDYIQVVDGEDLADKRDGAAHLGVWIGIVELAATCNPRGTLSKQGRALGIREIAGAIRMPVDVVEAAIERLLHVGWLEAGTQNQQDGGAANVRTHTDIQTDKTDMTDMRETQAREFLAAYPKKVQQERAIQVYLSLVDEVPLRDLMDGLTRWMASEQWQDSLAKDGGKYIPSPARWLADRRWLERPPSKVDPFEEAKKLLGGP